MRPIYINQAQNEVFCHFLEFGSYVYLEIAYNHIFRQYFASSIDKTYEKKIAGGGVGGGDGQIWTKRAKIRPKIRYFCHFLKFDLTHPSI